MANYDTTAEPIEAYYDPRQSIRNPDYQPFGGGGDAFSDYKGVKLLKSGWMPDKKHSFMENLGRVASLGIYNPDDRAASAINKQILAKHGLNQEEFGRVQQAHAEEIEKITNDIMQWDPTVPRPEARKLAIEMFSTSYFEDIATHKANTVQENVREEEMRGRKPGSRAFGESAVAGDTAANRARQAQMENVQRGAAAKGQLNVPESQAQVESGRAVNENMQLQDQAGDIRHKRLQDIELSPLIDRRALAEASQGATSAEARAGLWNSPFAKDLAQFEENKRLAINTPPWGTTAVPYPGVMENKVLGTEKPVGSQLNEYKTTTQRFDEAGRPMGWELRQRTRGANPTTADTNAPIAAPPMTAPVGPPKQGLKMTPEQFRALFNAQ